MPSVLLLLPAFAAHPETSAEAPSEIPPSKKSRRPKTFSSVLIIFQFLFLRRRRALFVFESNDLVLRIHNCPERFRRKLSERYQARRCSEGALEDGEIVPGDVIGKSARNRRGAAGRIAEFELRELPIG